MCKSVAPKETKCPLCGAVANKIGKARYYCHECYIEFTVDTKGHVRNAYTIDERGVLHQCQTVPA